MNGGLSDAEMSQLGYRRGPRGSWRLVNPNARPAPRPGLCRMCSKFDAALDGWCWGCVHFGPGDPHGVSAERRPADRTAPRLDLKQERLVERVREAAREVLGHG